MRIIFIGQAPFGRDCLQALLDQGEEIAGVLTVPDRPGQKGPNPVKELALQRGLPLLQPARLKEPEALTWVKNLRPDLLVLAFVTDIVPQAMIDLATYGGINYHPSLLPKYRGGSAMNWAIINGETETGVTIHQIDAGIDTGPIILQQKVAIDPDDTVKSLYFEKLYPLGVQMVAEAVRLIREGKASPVPQDERQASFQPVIKEADVQIDWRQSTQKIYNLIRGSNPNPGAWTTFRGGKLKIWEASPYRAYGNPGTIVAIPGEEGFVIATGDGAILVRRVQYGSSSDKVSALQFATSAAIRPGEQVGI
ncbi:methionyl-tRNA formyltransferase [Moorella sp. E308F]|uniref:methionyl-tRNA formyltransferase n=1 Tax=unclassified Neomoorella TaxID=2676739 RepID=UPI0010FFBD37|nr:MULTISPECIES: methionyl-tRNA formyltransferase [unclassified Moorella (in: firmicutes)]GEA14503.1 methionyl-tRNA formyltransferase [Moorella sp. E308F]GEA18125.1 methionyl-tRNA formyltransferase [Moorella sp. E306M]